MLLFDILHSSKELLHDWKCLCKYVYKPMVFILWCVCAYVCIDISLFSFNIIRNGYSQPQSTSNSYIAMTLHVILECFFYSLFLASWNSVLNESTLYDKIKMLKYVKQCILNGWRALTNYTMHPYFSFYALPLWSSLVCIYTQSIFILLAHSLIVYIHHTRNCKYNGDNPNGYHIKGKHIYIRHPSENMGNVCAIIKWDYIDSKCENARHDTSDIIDEEDWSLPDMHLK